MLVLPPFPPSIRRANSPSNFPQVYSMNLTGLAKYSKYSLAVEAYNSLGTGPSSLPEVLVSTLEDGRATYSA